MIVNEQHGFAWAHVPKTGGTSVRRALAELPDSQVHKGHKSFKDFDEQLGRHIIRWATVRNPWDRFYSGFRHMHRRRVPTTKDEFTQFVRDSATPSHWKHRTYILWSPEYWISAPSGTEVHILRFESLQADVDDLAKKMGFELPPLEHRNRCPHGPIDVWTPETIDAIGERYRDDIERYGYEPPATGA